eukprot:6915819-Prymnesium_polylepis.1
MMNACLAPSVRSHVQIVATNAIAHATRYRSQLYGAATPVQRRRCDPMPDVVSNARPHSQRYWPSAFRMYGANWLRAPGVKGSMWRRARAPAAVSARARGAQTARAVRPGALARRLVRLG